MKEEGALAVSKRKPRKGLRAVARIGNIKKLANFDKALKHLWKSKWPESMHLFEGAIIAKINNESKPASELRADADFVAPYIKEVTGIFCYTNTPTLTYMSLEIYGFLPPYYFAHQFFFKANELKRSPTMGKLYKLTSHPALHSVKDRKDFDDEIPQDEEIVDLSSKKPFSKRDHDKMMPVIVSEPKRSKPDKNIYSYDEGEENDVISITLEEDDMSDSSSDGDELKINESKIKKERQIIKIKKEIPQYDLLIYVLDVLHEQVSAIYKHGESRRKLFYFPVDISNIKDSVGGPNSLYYCLELLDYYRIDKSMRFEVDGSDKKMADEDRSWEIIRKHLPYSPIVERDEEDIQLSERYAAGDEAALDIYAHEERNRELHDFWIRKIYSYFTQTIREEFIVVERDVVKEWFSRFPNFDEASALFLLFSNIKYWSNAKPDRDSLGMSIYCISTLCDDARKYFAGYVDAKYIKPLDPEMDSFLNEVNDEIDCGLFWYGMDAHYCQTAVKENKAIVLPPGIAIASFRHIKEYITNKCIKSSIAMYEAQDTDVKCDALRENQFKNATETIRECWEFTDAMIKHPNRKRNNRMNAQKVIKTSSGQPLKWELPDIEDLADSEPPCIGMIRRNAYERGIHPKHKQRNLLMTYSNRIGYDSDSTVEYLSGMYEVSKMDHSKRKELEQMTHLNVKSTYEKLNSGSFGERSCITMASISKPGTHDTDQIGCPFIYASDIELRDYLEGKKVKNVEAIIDRTYEGIGAHRKKRTYGNWACELLFTDINGKDKLKNGVGKIIYPSHFTAMANASLLKEE